MKNIFFLFLLVAPLQAATVNQVMNQVTLANGTSAYWDITYDNVTNTLSGCHCGDYTPYPAALVMSLFGTQSNFTFTCATGTTVAIPIVGTIHISSFNAFGTPRNFDAIQGKFLWPK